MAPLDIFTLSNFFILWSPSLLVIILHHIFFSFFPLFLSVLAYSFFLDVMLWVHLFSPPSQMFLFYLCNSCKPILPITLSVQVTVLPSCLSLFQLLYHDKKSFLINNETKYQEEKASNYHSWTKMMIVKSQQLQQYQANWNIKSHVFKKKNAYS